MAATSSRGRSSGRGGRSTGTTTRGRSTGTGRSARASGTRGARGASAQARKSSRGSAAAEGEGTPRRRGAAAKGRGAQAKSRGAQPKPRGAQSKRRAGSSASSSRSAATRGRKAPASRSRAAKSPRSRSTSRTAGRTSNRASSRTSSRRTSARGSSTSRAPRTARRSKLDPIAMLMEDHRRVEKLFAQFERAKDAKKKQALFRSIRTELELHARLEEEVFYPDVEGRQELKSEVKEAHGEHDKVKQMLREAEGLDPDSGEFDATVAGIQGAVEHHVQEEEEQMFPSVRESFSEDHLRELGQKMTELKSAASRGNGVTGESRSLVGRLMGR